LAARRRRIRQGHRAGGGHLVGIVADAIPDSAVAVLDGVAHLAGLENPPLVNTLIDEFVFRE
jgi:hypothetical protein